MTPILNSTGELARHLYSKEGRIAFTMPEAGLPEALLQACRLTESYETSVDLIESVDQMLNAGRPGALVASLVLAVLQQQRGQMDQAFRRFEDLLQREPHPLVLNELANICERQHGFSRALEWRKQALAMSPDDLNLVVCCAKDYFNMREFDRGLRLLDELWDSDQINEAGLSAYLWLGHYVPGMDQDRLLKAHILWGKRYAPLSLTRKNHANTLERGRRLRVGYLTADLYSHAVGYVYDALLQGHDRSQVEVIGYGNIQTPDHATQYLIPMFDAYRSVYGTSDAELAELIRQDRIDILVATAGHSSNHRLKVLAYKPAPIQVDLGGINTTGIEQVDYRLTDSRLDPPGSESRYVEQSVFLEGGALRYACPQGAPPVGPLPALSKGYITFCSFNNHLKLNNHVLNLWAQVMQGIPESRLIIKCKANADPVLRQQFVDHFARFDIAEDRLTLLDWLSHEEHWQWYNQADIALDAYPFNGCITTLEALWMGIPTVSLAGSLWVSRMGFSLLSGVGLEICVAQSPDQFVAKALALASNVEALSRLRMSMRQRMQDSELCDGRGYARDLETAYRGMWQRWCQEFRS